MIKKILSFILLASLTLATNAFAESVAFTWDANTEPDLAKYTLYWGPASGDYSDKESFACTAGETACAFQTIDLEPATYFLVVTASDEAGNESGYSNEIEVTVLDTTAPAAPKNLLHYIPAGK